MIWKLNKLNNKKLKQRKSDMIEKKLAFEPHKIDKDKFRPIGSHIIVADMKFEQRITHGGILLPNDDMKSAGIRPRWAQIYAIGSEYNGGELEIGNWILISHGRWTRGIDIADESGKKTLRRVDPNDILMVADQYMGDETMSDMVY
jgi:co-chaperonin GroES (HSP10)